MSLKSKDDALTMGGLLCTLWKDTETAYRTSVELGKGGTDFSGLEVGASMSCTVNSKKDYGVVCDVDGHSDLIGLITHDQATRELKDGEKFVASVLDFDKIAGYIDLSMKEDLTTLRTGDKSLKKGESVDANVQLVHENCLVASIPSCRNAIRNSSFVTKPAPLASAKPKTVRLGKTIAGDVVLFAWLRCCLCLS